MIIYVRRNLPESPRWQIMHGKQREAEGSIAEIEHDVSATRGDLQPVDQSKELEIRPTERFGYLRLIQVLFALQSRCADRCIFTPGGRFTRRPAGIVT